MSMDNKSTQTHRIGLVEFTLGAKTDIVYAYSMEKK